jgi:hypothetical protein
MKILSTLPTFTRPVEIPRQDGTTETIEIAFRARTGRELSRYISASKDATSDADYLGESIDSWRGPVDEQGEPVAYSVDALDMLLWQCPSEAFEAIWSAYIQGNQDERAKNSAPLPGN